jgi:hypothetical protein
LAVPVALLYDRMLLLVAIGWLVREARSTGFRLWDKIVLLAAYLAPLVDYAVDSAWHLPLGPLISMAVLALALRRIGNAKVRHPDTQATTARSGDVAASAG